MSLLFRVLATMAIAAALLLAVTVAARSLAARTDAPTGGALAGGSASPSATPPRSIVPWTDARWTPAPPTPTPTPAPTPPTDVRLCRAGDLVIAEWTGNGATGWIIQAYAVGNRSDSPCLLRGAPGVRLVGAGGRPFAEVKPDEQSRRPSGGGNNWAVLAPRLTDVPPRDQRLPAGQAIFTFMTYGSCEHPIITRYEFLLAWDPSPIAIPVDPPRPFGGGRCDVPGQTLSLSVSSVAPAPTPEPPPQPTRSPLPITVTVDAPATVTHGGTVDYLMTLTNRSTSALSLEPCPIYVATIASDEPPRATTDPLSKPGFPPVPRLSYPPLVAKDTLHVLNCVPAGSLRPGEGATFAMRIEISPLAPLGPATLTVSLGAGKETYGQARLTVLP